MSDGFMREWRPVMYDAVSPVTLPVTKATEDKAAAVNESGCSAISERLRIALRDLQPEAKEVFLLRLNTGLAYEEIARIRRCPVHTVKTQMRLAVRELRKVLNERY